jgi:Family of unknown function (DUF5829)
MKLLKIVVILLLYPIITKSQTPNIELHTIFTCIDSVTYAKLFENKFIKDTLFLCRELSTATTAETYTGKYFIGQSATLEFFAPRPIMSTGDKFADLGIEIKTGKLNDQQYFFQQAKQKRLQCVIDTSKLEDSVKPLLFYTNLKIKDTVVTNRFAVSLIEYHREYLASYGFSDVDMNRFMNNKQLNEKLHGGKKYPRLFSGVTKITVQLNNAEYQYMQKTLALLGFIKRGNVFTGKGLTIQYSINEKAPFRLTSLSISLLQSMPYRNIIISDKLRFEVSGKLGKFEFRY